MKVPHAVDDFSGQLILLGQVVAKSIQLTFDAGGSSFLVRLEHSILCRKEFSLWHLEEINQNQKMNTQSN